MATERKLQGIIDNVNGECTMSRTGEYLSSSFHGGLNGDQIADLTVTIRPPCLGAPDLGYHRCGYDCLRSSNLEPLQSASCGDRVGWHASAAIRASRVIQAV